MTTIGFRAPGTLAPPLLPTSEKELADSRLTDGRVVALSRTPRFAGPPASWVRLGRVSATSAARYFVVWSAVLFVAQLVVFVLTYALLAAVGVLGSLSHALSVLSDKPLPHSGLLPALAPSHVLPALVIAALVSSLLFLAAAVGVVLVHNATSALTGGIAVRVRPEPRGRGRTA